MYVLIESKFARFKYVAIYVVVEDNFFFFCKRDFSIQSTWKDFY